MIPGAARMESYLPLLKGKKVAVAANPASVVEGRNIVDTLHTLQVDVVKIFSPEHGFRQWEEAGRNIPDAFDSLTGLQVVSLYGKKKKPGMQDLEGVDVVLFDMQDAGVRFFTYISTLTYIMEACAENSVPLIVLDRPNPNGFYIDGPVLDSNFRSFVGMHPVPVVYGMTIGEYARMVNGEGWLKNGIRCSLEVIPMHGYARKALYDLPVRPSPNLTTQVSLLLYPSLCFFEGTVVSVGRGTGMPFEVFGHPALKGFSFSFVPVSMPGMSIHPPYRGELCRGLDLRGFYARNPRMLGRINLSWLIMAYRDLGSDPAFFNDYFDTLAGTASLRLQIIQGLTMQQIRQSWEPGLCVFGKIREKYLIYGD